MKEQTLTNVPAGSIAAVVTHLEMTERPAPRPAREVPVRLREVAAPDPGWYRALFLEVGAGWLWFSRVAMSDAELRTAIRAPGLRVFAVEVEGADEGLLELDFGREGECHVAFLGLSGRLTGRGVGSWLMDQAMALAWAAPIRRVTLHTCTLDSPAALPFYLRSGFRPVRREVEIVPDPRLTGVLPEDAAPQIPLIRP